MLYKHTGLQASEIERLPYWRFETLIEILRKDLEKKADLIHEAKHGKVHRNEQIRIDSGY